MHMDEFVPKDSCVREHKRVDENLNRAEARLNNHSDRLDSVESAVLKLTILVEQAGRKSIFDKILIVSVFMMGVVLLTVVLGPELTGKVVGGAIK
jgi:hypothetical protein